MKKKYIFAVCMLLYLSILPKLGYAHNLEKHGSHEDVKHLLQPDDDLTKWEHFFLYSVNGLLIVFSIILISMLIRRKKTGKILILFLFALAIDYVIVLHYGGLLDLLG